MPIYTPYCYLIGWSKLNTWYYGVRFSRRAHPSDLWKSYFTSSKHVKRFAKSNGDPDVIQIRRTFSNKESALMWEHKALRRLDVKAREKFLNVSIGLGDMFYDATGKHQSDEHITKRVKSKSWYKHHSDETRAKISRASVGYVQTKDAYGNVHKVSVDDPRYVSGQFVHISTGKFCAVDEHGNKFMISKDDSRYISGELTAQSKGRIPHNKKHYPTEEETHITKLIEEHNIPINDRASWIWINNGSQRKRVHREMFELYFKHHGWLMGKKFEQRFS